MRASGHSGNGANTSAAKGRSRSTWMHSDPAWGTIHEIARLFGWTEAYARKQASEHQWRRTGRHPRLYSMSDALRCRSLRGRAD